MKSPRCWRLCALLFALLSACFAAGAQPAEGLSTELDQQVRQLALAATRAAGPGVTRVEVVVGSLDPRLRLAACARIEPYLPPSATLWGRSRIGLRCLEGPSRWNVYLPITVKVYGPALVAATALPAGSQIGPGDLSSAEIDLAEEPAPALTNSAVAVGRVLARAVRPGQGLRQTDLRTRQWFAAGETVQIRATGAGFSVSSEGQALSNGMEGQPARVRIDGGRTVTGMPVGQHRVELTL
ncbi:MAG: flagellar basal body P-ring formation chaperone FlgA [Burkholderiaceae bacterium]